MISEDTIDKVRELSIVDVVSQYVSGLKKSGSSHKALSPFTNEKSPSFYVHPVKNIFKCFSTGKGGDAITFVMEKEGLSYPDAIKDIAGKFGIDVQYDSNGMPQEQRDEIELLYKINQSAANAYARRLLDVDGTHPAFLELINKRRFSPDTIAQWQIGYAPGEVSESYTPSKWNFLAKTMIAKGYYEQGEHLGLIKTKNEVNYDAFRNRITFPIIDQHGRFVAFGARALKADQYNAKYLNSPESKIYQKGKVLFGLNFAAGEIRKKDYALLMEGYTDVISFHQAGLNNSVGTCGTALGDDQCKLLRKYTNKVVLVYDPDEAGQNAAARSIDLLMQHGFQTSVLPLPTIIETRRPAATKHDPSTQPWRELVFVINRSRESITVRHYSNDGDMSIREEIDIPVSEVVSTFKIDPDELVRMFNN